MKNLTSLTIVLLVLSRTTALYTPRQVLRTHHHHQHNISSTPSTFQDHHQAIVSRQRKTERSMISSQALVYGTAVATTFGMQTIGFVAAYLLKTEVFYDIFGGVNYLLLAVLSATLGASTDGTLPWVNDPRKILTTILFSCSRGWLLLFLAWRAHERKGDARFDEVLGKNGGTPQPINFFVFWMAQAFWVILVSMPMLFVNSSSVQKPNFSVYDIVTAILFGGGVLIEIVADIQKAMWVKAGRQGVFCDVGVWKYSRHPNYFGEIFQWWCLFAFSYSSSVNPKGGYADWLWWAGIVSPLFTMQILLNMQPTGICNAEGKNLKRYYDKCPERYAKYHKNTSILIPFIGYGLVPQFLKRTLFFYFDKYQYKPRDADAGTVNKDE
jgi:steroid 5-alpha reductase family enzyme